MARSRRCGSSARRHVGVVLEQVALGDAQLGPEGLAQVGEADRARPGAPPRVDVPGRRRAGSSAASLRATGRGAARGAVVARGGPGRAHRARRPAPRRELRGAAAPCRTAPATGHVVQLRPASTQRSISPPRLMSPRPTNVGGEEQPRRRTTSSSTSTYLPLATLPSSTTSQPGPAAASASAWRRAAAAAGSAALPSSIDPLREARAAARGPPRARASAGRRWG